MPQSAEDILGHDEPIIIKGGSLDVEYDDRFDDVSEPSSRRKKFKHRDTVRARITSVTIQSGNSPEKFVFTPDRGKCTITIEYTTH